MALKDHPIENPVELKQLVAEFILAHGAALPADIAGELIAASTITPPSQQGKRVVEALYAALDPARADTLTGDIRAAAATLMGRLAIYLDTMFNCLSDDNRAMVLYAIARRELGETTGPGADKDPARKFGEPAPAPDAPRPAPVATPEPAQ
jgi:hypothetical protein